MFGLDGRSWENELHFLFDLKNSQVKNHFPNLSMSCIASRRTKQLFH